MSDVGFVNNIKHCVKASILSMRAILDLRPDAIFVFSESTEYVHPGSPAVVEQAHFMNERRFLALDLTYGYPISVTMYHYLLDNGITREEYEWFGKNHVKARCVMGNDYYVTNEHHVASNGSTSASGEIFGYNEITRQYYDRYRLPVMHTETNTPNANDAPMMSSRRLTDVRRDVIVTSWT